MAPRGINLVKKLVTYFVNDLVIDLDEDPVTVQDINLVIAMVSDQVIKVVID